MDSPYQFHTVKEIADILRVSDWSIYDAVRQGGMTYEALEQQAS